MDLNQHNHTTKYSGQTNMRHCVGHLMKSFTHAQSSGTGSTINSCHSSRHVRRQAWTGPILLHDHSHIKNISCMWYRINWNWSVILIFPTNINLHGAKGQGGTKLVNQWGQSNKAVLIFKTCWHDWIWITFIGIWHEKRNNCFYIFICCTFGCLVLAI